MTNKAVNPGKEIKRHLPSILSVCIYGILLVASVSGLDRDRNIAQFHHTSWSAKEGAPGQIRAIAQTNDGYLWLGTSTGLYRFDGVQFESYMPRSGGNFPSNNIYTMLVTPDDGLWIGYWYGGVSFLKDGNLTNYGEPEGLSPGKVNNFAKDHEGTIWAAVRGGLSRLVGTRWQRVGPEWNYPGKMARTVFVDKVGTLWVSTEDTIMFLPKGSRFFKPTGEKTGQVLNIDQSPDGALWMAETSQAVRQLQMPGIEPRSLGPEIIIGSVGILFDREGALWITSIGDGLRRLPYTDRFRGQTLASPHTDAEIFTEEDGLSDNYVYTVFEDREGNIWMGTANGLDRFRASNFVPVRFPPGYQDFGLAAGDEGEIWTGSSNKGANRIRGGIPTRVELDIAISFIFRDEEGAIWMSGSNAIFRWHGNKFSKLAIPSGLKVLGASMMFKDRGGVLWVYTDQEGAFQFKDGNWSRYDRQTELPKSLPIIGAIDSLDRKWFGYAANKLTVIDGANIRTFSQDDGLGVGDVKVIKERNEHIWVGGTLGVAVFEGNRFRMLTAEGTEGFNGVSGIIETGDGTLWLNASRGIIQISGDQVRLSFENPAYRVRYRVFDFLDGLPGAAQQNRPFPTAVEGSDGRLWFSTSKGVAWIDPKQISTNTAAPPVLIRSLYADEKLYEPVPSVELPEGTMRLQIDFTALSLSIPERIRFRYKLEAVDGDWQEAGMRRQAFYNSLAPGRYLFRVIASNNDGVWNENGATLDFTIKPAFYQTLWFRLASFFLALLFVGVILRLLYIRRVSQATKRLNAQFDERLMERTRISQELHDTLLQGFLGVTMRLQAISNLLPAKSEMAKENLDEVLNQVDTVLEEGRRAIWDLHSSTVTENDLMQAFTLVGEDLNKTYPADFSLTIEGESRPLHPLVRDEVYRIGREALTNAFRHSKANKIEAGIEYASKYLRIFIRDNGCGISPDFLNDGREGHLGLSGMRDFAEKIDAELKIWSRAESGTEVELIVPSRAAFVKKSSGSLLKRLSHLHRRKAATSEQKDQQK